MCSSLEMDRLYCELFIYLLHGHIKDFYRKLFTYFAQMSKKKIFFSQLTYSLHKHQTERLHLNRFLFLAQYSIFYTTFITALYLNLYNRSSFKTFATEIPIMSVALSKVSRAIF